MSDQLTGEILAGKPLNVFNCTVVLCCIGNAFQQYSEQPITFFPSYKYDLDSDVYDSSPKKRTPSWTVSYSIVAHKSRCVCVFVYTGSYTVSVKRQWRE